MHHILSCIMFPNSHYSLLNQRKMMKIDGHAVCEWDKALQLSALSESFGTQCWYLNASRMCLLLVNLISIQHSLVIRSYSISTSNWWHIKSHSLAVHFDIYRDLIFLKSTFPLFSSAHPDQPQSHITFSDAIFTLTIRHSFTILLQS